MKRLLIVLAGLCLSSSLWAATTYTYTGAPFTSITNFTSPCATGPCANYPAGSSITGSFTTSVALAAGLANVNVYPSVVSFSFTDGITTFSSADPNSRVYEFLVSTDGSGNITGFNIFLELWLTGSSPHGAGDRFSYIFFTSPGGVNALINQPCTTASVSVAGVADTCTLSPGPDASTSRGQTFGVGTWAPVGGPPAASQTPVPALSAWAMIALSLLVVAFAARALHRRT